MAGVAQHSRYQHDPLGRMLQTANFIGFTTYGDRARAHAAIQRVLAVHEGVRGIADDGTPYFANDPHLLLWVHCAEISLFLESYRRFGPERLSDAECDSYVKEMAGLARDLGITAPPETQLELRQQIELFRRELRLSEDGVTARDWLRYHAVTSRMQRAVFFFLVRSSLDLLPPWAGAELELRCSGPFARAVITPTTRALTRILRRFVPPTTRWTGGAN
jgi:uncharacterized protein (DUF2236 family)